MATHEGNTCYDGTSWHSAHAWSDGADGETTCVRCGEGVGVEAIEALRDEAQAAGDAAQVGLCDRALTGDAQAVEACARAIADAAAMDDSEVRA